VQSSDNGKPDQKTELMYAHPFGGSQRPLFIAIKDAQFLVQVIAGFSVDQMAYPFKAPIGLIVGTATFYGGYLSCSYDVKTCG